MFLKKVFLSQPFEPPNGFIRFVRQRKLPVVLTREEVTRLLTKLEGVHYLLAGLLYGSGLRRIELVRLRVKDIDLDFKQVRVMFGKGGKDRIVTLAEELLRPLRHQVKRVALLLQQDQQHASYGGAWIPEATVRRRHSNRTATAGAF